MQRPIFQVRGAANPPQYQSTQPAIMQPTQELPPPAYTKTGQQMQQPQLSAVEFQASFTKLFTQFHL